MGTVVFLWGGEAGSNIYRICSSSAKQVQQPFRKGCICVTLVLVWIPALVLAQQCQDVKDPEVGHTPKRGVWFRYVVLCLKIFTKDPDHLIIPYPFFTSLRTSWWQGDLHTLKKLLSMNLLKLGRSIWKLQPPCMREIGGSGFGKCGISHKCCVSESPLWDSFLLCSPKWDEVSRMIFTPIYCVYAGPRPWWSSECPTPCKNTQTFPM